MIKLKIVAVGKLKESFWREAVEEYRKRIGKFGVLQIIEVDDSPDEGVQNPARQLAEEAALILRNLHGFAVLLDLDGKALSSEELAALVSEKALSGVSELTFIIGGSRGVSEEVRKRADLRVSFGRVTYPHQLMRVILAEQLYRAMTIINNTGYHK